MTNTRKRRLSWSRSCLDARSSVKNRNSHSTARHRCTFSCYHHYYNRRRGRSGVQGVNRCIIHCDIVKISYRCHHNMGIIIIANIILSFGPSRWVGGGRAELKHRRAARENGQRAHARTENYVALRIAGFVIIYDCLPLSLPPSDRQHTTARINFCRKLFHFFAVYILHKII